MLPQWQGHPVPWVALWSGEKVATHRDIQVTRRNDGGLAIYYPNSKDENRDRFGVLWQKQGIGRGGDPLFGAVNTYRQRRCMTKSRCQVCGGPVEDRAEGGKFTPWLMPLEDDGTSFLQWINDGVQVEPIPVTATPPTCAACIPLALDVCPNLRTNGYELYHVLEWGVYGVRGYHHFLAQGQVQRRHAVVPYDKTGYEDTPVAEGATLAQQMVVVWQKFVKKEVVRP